MSLFFVTKCLSETGQVAVNRWVGVAGRGLIEMPMIRLAKDRITFLYLREWRWRGNLSASDVTLVTKAIQLLIITANADAAAKLWSIRCFVDIYHRS